MSSVETGYGEPKFRLRRVTSLNADILIESTRQLEKVITRYLQRHRQCTGGTTRACPQQSDKFLYE